MKYKFLLLLMTQIHFHCSSLEITARKKLKILMVLDRFPCAIQTFVLGQIAGLIDKGHDVQIFTKKKWSKEIPSRVVEEYELLKKTTYETLPHDLDSFDIVYCQFGHIASDFIALKKERKVPWKLVIAFRGYDVTSMIVRDPEAHKDLFALADLLLPVCNHFKDILVRTGCNEDKVKVHHSAIDCSKFTFMMRGLATKKNIHIVTTARLVPEKGVDLSLDVMMKIMKKYPGVTYSVVGDGYMKKSLVRECRIAGLRDRVRFWGFLPHDQVLRVLETADIFLLTSVTRPSNILEGIPNALMEAMALGIPVVSTYHSGIPELVAHKESGLLAREYDKEALFCFVEYLINHQEMWHIFGCAGRAYVEQEHNIIFANQRLEQILYDLKEAKQ